MKYWFPPSMSFILTALLVVLVGCDAQQAAKDEMTASSHDDHSHDDHSHDDHSHDDHSHDDHSHDEGPHGGILADWGDGDYHVEFTVDHQRQEATVYIVGADAKTIAPIKASELTLSIADQAMQLTLRAAPQPGDPNGSASRFGGHHEGLAVVKTYRGTIVGMVDETPYAGDVDEAHADNDGALMHVGAIDRRASEAQVERPSHCNERSAGNTRQD